MELKKALEEIFKKDKKMMNNTFYLSSIIKDKVYSSYKEISDSDDFVLILKHVNVFDILFNNSKEVSIKKLLSMDKSIKLEYQRYREIIDICIGIVYKQYKPIQVKQKNINIQNVNKENNVLFSEKKNIVISCNTGNITIFVDSHEGMHIDGVKQNIGNDKTLKYKYNTQNVVFHISNSLIDKLVVYSHVGNVNIHNNSDSVLDNIEVESSVGTINLYGKYNKPKLKNSIGKINMF